jgi:hypothetical protein
LPKAVWRETILGEGTSDAEWTVTLKTVDREDQHLRSMMISDLRYLCLCAVCGKLGNERAMVKAGPMEWLAHDRCVFEQLGDGILNLPKEEKAKFTLAAVGPDMMRRLGARTCNPSAIDK